MYLPIAVVIVTMMMMMMMMMIVVRSAMSVWRYSERKKRLSALAAVISKPLEGAIAIVISYRTSYLFETS
jgi:hypothetical protein